MNLKSLSAVALVALGSRMLLNHLKGLSLPSLTRHDAHAIFGAFWPTMLTATTLLLSITQGHRSGHISDAYARKSIHIGMGLVYASFWPLFPEHAYSRVACAGVPLLSTLAVAAVGVGLIHDKALVAAAARSGQRQELLYGPVLYGIAIVTSTLWFWRDTPAGVMGIAVLCAGDGLAELIGRRYGRARLPHNRAKTAAGSTACLLGGFTAALLLALYFQSQDLFDPALTALEILAAAAAASVAGTLAESLPQGPFDNLSVTVAATLAAHCAIRRTG